MKRGTSEIGSNGRGGQGGEGPVALAIQDLQKATELDPGDAVAWYQLGLALQKARQADKAIEALENACNYDSSNETYCLTLGKALTCLKRLSNLSASR